MRLTYKKLDLILLIRLARFKKEVKKLPSLKIPESIIRAAEANGYKFNNQKKEKRL